MPGTLYGLVRDGAVIEGPRTLPPSWRTDTIEILAFDRIDDPTPFGWWPWTEASAPSFDPAKQRLEPQIAVDLDGKCVTRFYLAVALSEAERGAARVVPDAPTNSDWRVGLVLWGRFKEVEAKVIAARDSGSVQGQIVWQRWEYANNVYRAELMELRGLFGFSEDEVDESLARADAVARAARAVA